MTTSSTGPLIPRRRLGAAFHGLREARGETLQRTAKALMFSPSKLSRIENGLAGEPHPRDVRDLIAHFGVEPTEAIRLEELAAEARKPGWWQVPPYEMPSRIDTLISFESAASRIDSYVPTVVPGLLQTPEYARATISRAAPHLSPDAVDVQVELRMERQRQLRDRPNSPPRQRYAAPETILHRRVGTASVMRNQLTELARTIENPLVEFYVIPFDAGIYEAVELSDTRIFSFANDADCDVVAIERARYIDFLEKPHTLEKYRGIFERLSDYWLDRSESSAFIERVLQVKWQG